MAATGISPKHWIKNKSVLLPNIRDDSKAKGKFNSDWCGSRLSWLGINCFKISGLKSISWRLTWLWMSSLRLTGPGLIWLLISSFGKIGLGKSSIRSSSL